MCVLILYQTDLWQEKVYEWQTDDFEGRKKERKEVKNLFILVTHWILVGFTWMTQFIAILFPSCISFALECKTCCHQNPLICPIAMQRKKEEEEYNITVILVVYMCKCASQTSLDYLNHFSVYWLFFFLYTYSHSLFFPWHKVKERRFRSFFFCHSFSFWNEKKRIKTKTVSSLLNRRDICTCTFNHMCRYTNTTIYW